MCALVLGGTCRVLSLSKRAPCLLCGFVPDHLETSDLNPGVGHFAFITVLIMSLFVLTLAYKMPGQSSEFERKVNDVVRREEPKMLLYATHCLLIFI